MSNKFLKSCPENQKSQSDGRITPPLKGGYLTPHHPPVFCAIDVIIGRYRVFILSMSRVFIFSLCCVKFLVCVMFSFFACVVCSFSTTTRPTADGGRFAPAGLASRARSIAHCALPQVPPPVQYEGGGDRKMISALLRGCYPPR